MKQYSEAQIESIVMQVVKSLAAQGTGKPASSMAGGQMGVCEDIADAIDAAYEAQKHYIKNVTMKQRGEMIDAMRKTALAHNETLAKMAVEETGLGRWEDKMVKNEVVIKGTPGIEVLTTHAQSGDNGLMIEEYTPYGLIGAITPTTNPAATIINNAISMLAAGNSVVFNVHPSAKRTCAHAVDILNRAIRETVGVANLLTMVKEPTMDTAGMLMKSDKVRILVGTGGMGLVRTLLSSGKKCIGAGAGNPPVVVDETADIAHAAQQIHYGASFDNNVLCLAEKEVFVVGSVADEFIRCMVREGAYLLNKDELQEILALVLYRDEAGHHPQKDWVGKSAHLMLEAIGVKGRNARLLIFEAPFECPFVQTEQLMPVLPIVRCANVDEAIDLAVKAERGNRHTASMFSRNVDNMTKFAAAVDTTIFVKNASTLASVGAGGEGSATMTIAGPTGEGLTDARSFARRRRCSLCDGGFKIY